MKFFLIFLFFASLGYSAPAMAATAQDSPVAAPDAFETKPLNLDNSGTAPAAEAQPAVYRSNGFDPFRVTLALGAVVGLIFLLRVGAKRAFPGAVGVRSIPSIKVLSRSVITHRQSLLLIQVGKRLLVVGDSGAQLNPLCEISSEEEVAALLGQVRDETSVAARHFENLFGKMRRKFDETKLEDAMESEEAKIAGSRDVTQPTDSFDSSHELPDPELAEARQELSGLSEKVRDLVKQLGRA